MKKTTFLIVGKHPVLEALKNPSRKIERVFLTEDAQKKLNRENQSLNLFKSVNVFFKSRKELDNLCGKDETAHQGLVAEVEQLEEITLKEYILENKEKNLNLQTFRKNLLLETQTLHLVHLLFSKLPQVFLDLGPQEQCKLLSVFSKVSK